MAHIETGTTARRRVPARAHTGTTPGRVETQTGYHHEDMTTLNEYRKPFAVSGTPPAQELAARAEILLTHGTDLAQDEPNGAGAIICGIMVPPMATATAVRTPDNLVGSCNDSLNSGRGISRRYSLIATHVCSIALYVLIRRSYGILLLLLLLLTPVERDKQRAKHQC